MKYFVWDLETLINFFSFTGKFVGENSYYAFEISPRRNQRDQLLSLLKDLEVKDVTMVGFNSLGFDYPILHSLLTQPHTFDYTTAYKLCQEIIGGQSYGNPGNRGVRYGDRIIKQLDLVKLNHFDNENRRVALKTLQFAMRSESVEDLPVKIGVPLTNEEMDLTLKYNLHDVTETEKFFNHCKNLLDLRLDLKDNGVLRGDVLNYSNTKIGAEFLINKIGRAKCFIKPGQPRQTIRSRIAIKEVILPHVTFYNDEFIKVKEWFQSLDINLAGKRESPKLKTKLAGLEFVFGLGGVHASAEGKVYKSSDTHKILDVDVGGMYPSVGVANSLYPEHLGTDFIAPYAQLKNDRKQYPKGTAMNAALKEGSNAAYGNSNNPYSCFFDTKYTYTTTVNGQLQLLQLVEVLSMIPGVEIIQANTDGITLYYPRDMDVWVKSWCKEWERLTRLELEEAEYSGMWIADVNNYIALNVNGKIKRKGRYWYPESWGDYEGQWHKDFSSLIVPKLTSEVMINGYRAEDLITLSTDPFDFMLCHKTPSGATTYIGEIEQGRTTRYYISTEGEPMKKISKPKGEIGTWKRKNSLSDSFYNKILSEIDEGAWDERIHTKNKSKYNLRTDSICAGRRVKQCNNAVDFNWNDLDYDYYLKEVEKLVIYDTSK